MRTAALLRSVPSACQLGRSSDGRQSALCGAPQRPMNSAEEGDLAMYGTIARMRPKAGHEQEVLDLMEQWNRERKPNVRGAIGGYMLRPDRDPRDVVLM